jgi:4-hydroxybenzoate polyprenyltransferase
MIATALAPTLTLATVARALRVEQWVKNLLVFMPLLMAPEIVEIPLYADAFLAFVSFSLCASGVYLVNDLVDVDSDRQHATKHRRPIAAGELSVGVAWVLAGCTLAAGLSVAALLPGLFAAVLIAYLVLTTCYTLRWKHVPLVDVLVLAILYAWRVVAGGVATYVVPSPWLLGFSLFFFLSLAFVKRYAELRPLGNSESSLKVRGYYAGDLDLITINGTVSGYCAVLVAALYINGDSASGIYLYPEILWLVCPLLLYWISRIWMLAHRGELHEDPVLFAIRDRTSWIVAVLLALVLLAARI